MKILAFGEILWDLIGEEKHIGGAPFNFTAHAHQCGAHAGIVSCLGNDALGVQAMQEAEKLGIDTSLILRRNKRTGVVKVKLKDGHPKYKIQENVAYDYIDVGRLPHDLISSFDYFYFGTLAQRMESSRQSLYRILKDNSFREIFYDVNLRRKSFTKEIVEDSLSHCTIFKVSDEESGSLSKLLYRKQIEQNDFVHSILSDYPGIKLIIMTEGAKGCEIFNRDQIFKVPSAEITVKDTVGAGDSFSASFFTTYIKTGDPVKSAKIANKVGGYVASHSGAVPEYSTEIKSLLK